MVELFIKDIIKYNPKADMELLRKAYYFSEKAHEGQMRKSGERYFTHPCEVAKILIEMEMDIATIIGGLLHDVIEDTLFTFEQISDEFGEEIALLVDGVTKLGKLTFESKEERQVESLRKMFIAMAKDIRVLMIKLADRLHNMRTIKYMDEDKIREKCVETLEIYAPLAHRLGISKIKWELEDIAFRELEPEAYYDLAHKVVKKRKEREADIENVIDSLKSSLEGLNVEYEITGRSKHFYSIYRKMKYQQKELGEIFDLTAVRIIVDSLKDCYAILGIVHTLWKPIPGRFKDYIAMPKPNFYQSLHTTVLGANGEPFEIQIRTWDMHKIAEFGIAAHWKYKEGKQNNEEFEDKLTWLRQMLEWQKEMDDPREFMESLKLDLFTNQVFVFTPQGDVMDLPLGSTPLDFAYKIHSEIGNKCVGAKVDGRIVPLDYALKNGNIVEILTSSNSNGPSIDWLKIVKSTQAKNKIRQWLKKIDRDKNVDKGREMLEKYIRRKGFDTQDFLKPTWMNKVVKKLRLNSTDDLYAAIGYGGIMLNKVMPILNDYYKEENQSHLKQAEPLPVITKSNKPKEKTNYATGVHVEGVDNLLIRFSKCCNPVHGDEIVGFITKGRGISIHRKDCSNIVSQPELLPRLIEVKWDSNDNKASYETEINIVAEDRKGLLSQITQVLDDINLKVTAINAKSSVENTSQINLTIQINDTKQLDKLIRKIKTMESVMDVYRVIS